MMKSFDTNILVYASNADCLEHQKALELIEHAVNEPEDWIVPEQIYFEFYRLIRNPTVVGKPLNAAQAYTAVDFYRNNSGFLHCCYESSSWNNVEKWLRDSQVPARNIFDLKLAVTLKDNQVSEFYTRNIRDFEAFGWFDCINPID